MLARYLLEGAPGLGGLLQLVKNIQTCLNLFCLKPKMCDLGWKALRDVGLVLDGRDLVPNLCHGQGHLSLEPHPTWP